MSNWAVMVPEESEPVLKKRKASLFAPDPEAEVIDAEFPDDRGEKVRREFVAPEGETPKELIKRSKTLRRKFGVPSHTTRQQQVAEHEARVARQVANQGGLLNQVDSRMLIKLMKRLGRLVRVVYGNEHAQQFRQMTEELQRMLDEASERLTEKEEEEEEAQNDT